jgi:N4-gp56 family major capsid protein
MSNAIKTQYNRNLLMRALPRLIHGRWGQHSVLNKFGSEEWRRYGGLAAVTSAIGTEGSTPAEETAPSLTLVTATPLFYGAWLGVTDEIDFTSIDATVMYMSAILGEQAGLSIDTLRRNEITDGGTDVFAGGNTARNQLSSPNSDISYKDLLKCIAVLDGGNAKRLANGRYVLILHSDSLYTLFLDPTVVNLFTFEASREAGSALRAGYVAGSPILGLDIYVTSNAREYANGGLGSTPDVYSALFIGEEAYGMSGMGSIAPKEVDNAGTESLNMTGRGGVSASPVRLIVKQLGFADELDQRGSVGWKAGEDTVILNAAFLINYEHTNFRSDD